MPRPRLQGSPFGPAVKSTWSSAADMPLLMLQVPVPVVVMVPQLFKAAELLSAGSTTIYLTNTGLITANDVTLSLPNPMVRASASLCRRGRPLLSLLLVACISGWLCFAVWTQYPLLGFALWRGLALV